MIPRLKPYISISDLKTIWPRKDRNQNIRDFESRFARLAGQNYAIAFPYGRTAQIAILRALGLKNSEIICPSYTCVVVSHAIVKSGNKPVFVDVHEHDYNMDWEYVENATNEKTGAVIATSIFGNPVSLQALNEYKKKHPDIFILQDCAHSFLAGNSNQLGIAAFFGLNISKIITSIFGGMVTTDSKEFAEALQKERAKLVESADIMKEFKRSVYLIAVLVAFNPIVYGLVNRMERLGLLKRFVKYYDETVIDLPKDAFIGMSGVEARLGKLQCERYYRIVEHRRKLASIYREHLLDKKELILPSEHHDATYSHFVIRTKNAKQIMSHCLKNSVQLGELIDYEIPDMPTYKDAPYFGEHRSREFPGNVVNLPVHMGVSTKDAIMISDLIKEVTME